MKKNHSLLLFFLVVSLVSLLQPVMGGSLRQHEQGKRILFDQGHRLPLDLDSQDYQKLLQTLRVRSDVGPETLEEITTVESVIEFLIKKGARNADFLKFINSKKPVNEQLAFTNAELQKKSGIPIDKPKTYSPEIITKQLDEMKQQIPVQMREIILGTAEFTYPLSVNDDEYLDWARKIDKLYQTAARWKTMAPYLDYLAQRKSEDIRGYYFLMKEENLESKLLGWNALPNEDQIRLTGHLEGLCLQSQNEKACTAQLHAAIANTKNDIQSVNKFYLQKTVASKAVYDEFFMLVNPRPEAVWISTATPVLKLPFRDPQDQSILNFLKNNIEDEWKFNVWKLILDFTAAAPVSVVFQPGVTPHVNGLGGNLITMDSNQPMTEFGTQWTIRHEFGHVLGLPDCYVEFYDQSKKEIVSYQIDIGNIMCSRAGHIQQTHLDELEKSYHK